MATLVFRMRKKKLQFHCQIGLVGSYITTHARSFFEILNVGYGKVSIKEKKVWYYIAMMEIEILFLDQTRT